MTENKSFHSGFVSLLGRPNVGKSTLLNRMVGQPISITANKPQTTRNQIRGIITRDDFQAIVLDTPGIHLPQNELHRRIVNYAIRSIHENDLIFFITNPVENVKFGIPKSDQLVLKHLAGLKEKVVLVINKIDESDQSKVLQTISLYNKEHSFLETVPISAKTGSGVPVLESFFAKYLPAGIPYFPEDQITDSPERSIVGELIREQITRLCFQEVPYGVAVAIENFKEKEKKIEIYATIYVERESHKKIIIGKKGAMLKKVGQRSRIKMEHMLGVGVFLSTHVKVSKNWFNNPGRLNELGYAEMQ